MSDTILVWAEIKENELRKAALETVGAALELAGKLGGEVEVALCGAAVGDNCTSALSALGVAKIYVVEHEEFSEFEPCRFADALAGIVAQAVPKLILMPATAFGKDLSGDVLRIPEWVSIL